MKQFTQEILNHVIEKNDLGEAGEIIQDNTNEVLDRIDGIINEQGTCDNVDVMELEYQALGMLDNV